MDWIDAVVASAMEEVQRNGVPVIRALLAQAAQEAPPKMCSIDSDCEACQ